VSSEESGRGAAAIVRAKQGVTGETRRTSHLVDCDPSQPLPGAVVARCGERFQLGQIDLLPEFAGMPCVKCLVKSEVPGSPSLAEPSAGELQLLSHVWRD
jgi:hypothetical protein